MSEERIRLMEEAFKKLEAKIGGITDACVAMCSALDNTLDQLIKECDIHKGETGELAKKLKAVFQKEMSKEAASQLNEFMTVISLDDIVGPNGVLCDLCGKDWTDSDVSGGFLMGSARAVCPDCAPRIEADAIKFEETEHITNRCPPNMSHADWIRDVVRPASKPGGPDIIRTVKHWREKDNDEG